MIPNKVEPPQKTWFFENYLGKVFAVQEQEAWRIINEKNNFIGIRRPAPKLLGCSDGTTYHRHVVESHQLHRTDPDKAVQKLRDGFEAELEKARGNMDLPRNMDTRMGFTGETVDISRLR